MYHILNNQGTMHIGCYYRLDVFVLDFYLVDFVNKTVILKIQI